MRSTGSSVVLIAQYDSMLRIILCMLGQYPTLLVTRISFHLFLSSCCISCILFHIASTFSICSAASFSNWAICSSSSSVLSMPRRARLLEAADRTDSSSVLSLSARSYSSRAVDSLLLASSFISSSFSLNSWRVSSSISSQRSSVDM